MGIKHSRPVPPFMRYCSAIIPTMFDDSLSYYEALCALNRFIQKNLVEVINNNAKVTEEYIKLVDDLKEYVEHYFDNLDVQEEINNKLDAMAEDGTLQTIFTDAMSVLTQDTLNFHTYMALLRNTGGLQGGCVLPDQTIIQFTGQDVVYHVASDGTVINQATVLVGHANSACYSETTGKVYVTSTQDNDLGRYKIYEIDPLTLAIENTYDMQGVFPKEPYGIAYFADEECFVFCNFWDNTNVKTMWKTDKDFNVLATKTFNIEMRSIANLSNVDGYVGVSNFSKHTIMLFDVATMEFLREVKVNNVISDVWVSTEEEWYDTRDGIIYLGCVCGSNADPHAGSTYVYASMNPLQNYETSKYSVETSPHNEIYYIDHTATNILRDGRSANPFRNVYEALNASLKIGNTTGMVRFNFVNADSNRSYRLVLTMPKSYDFEMQSDDPFNFFSHISIGSATQLTISKSVSFVDNETKVNPFNYGDGADIVCHGKLICNNTISNADGTRLYIKGNQNAYLRFGITNDGIDLKTFYGVIENTNNVMLSKSDLITNFGATNTNAWHTPEVKGIQYQLTANADDNKFYIPPFTQNGIAICKFKVTVAGVAQQLEEGLPYRLNRWMEYAFFNTTDGTKTRILFNTSGRIDPSNTTLERVVICN